jgi:hypothetical protein
LITDAKKQKKQAETKRLIASDLATQLQTLAPQFAADETGAHIFVESLLKAKQNHELAQNTQLDFLRYAIECGRGLSQTKKMIAYGDWVETFKTQLSPVLGFSVRTMQRYLASYAKFQKFLRSQPVVNGHLDQAKLLDAYIEYEVTSKVDEPQDDGSVEANDWLTPPQVLEAVLAYFDGAIGTDPCAWSRYVDHVPASRKYSRANSGDGLAADCSWPDRVYAAPGHKVDLGPWVDKALLQVSSRTATEVVLFAPVLSILSLEKLSHRPLAIFRDKFVVGADESNGKKGFSLPMMALVLITDAPKCDRFFDCFGTLAAVYRPVANSTETSPVTFIAQTIDSVAVVE